jgi:hypothetical protein
MGKIFENSYYIDVDGIIEKCKTGGMLQDEDGKEVIEINVFKYELIKMLLDRVINDFDDEMEEDLDIFSKNQSNSKSFNLAFNTLIQYGIILEI